MYLKNDNGVFRSRPQLRASLFVLAGIVPANNGGDDNDDQDNNEETDPSFLACGTSRLDGVIRVFQATIINV